MQPNEPTSSPDQQNSSSQPVDASPTTEALTSQQPTVSKKITNWLLVGLVVLLLGSTGVFAYKYYELKQQINNQQPIPSTPTTETQITPSPPTPSPFPTVESSANFKTYSNEKYGFSFSYPQNWQISDIQGPGGLGVSLSNIADGHTISVQVWRVTGFGYCYKYSERDEIIVGGKNAETADGVGGSEMCDKPEEYSGLGNTFVLIPIDDARTGLPRNQIHISYDYPLSDINLAKSNLDQILSTFKFTN